MSKYKRFISPTLTVLMLTSQLTGCSTTNAAETMNMLKANETIEINIPEPENIEEGKEISYNWIELAYLDSYESLRNTMDDSLYIIKMADNGKNGVIYVTEDGNHSNNTTLQDAFNNKKFINNYWNNKETNQRIIQSAKQTFSDLEDESDASCVLAAYSAYYNLLPSYDANYANMQSTLSRLEAMSLLYRAVNPVDDTLQVSADFTSKVGDNEHSIFAEQIDNQGLTYLTSKNSSLDESTATGTMTRAEYIYMLVQNFYADEYNTLTKDDIKSFSKSTELVDLKNAGNVAKEQKYIYTEKNPETKQKEEKAYNRYQSYELNYCLQNVEDGLTENLYKAYIVASNHGILTDTEETNWELGLTKEYALELLTNTLEETGSNVNYDRGESKGEAIINKVETEKTEEINTVGQGGDKSLLNELQQAENTEDLPWDLQMEQNGGEYVSSTADQYFVKSADGSYEFTPEFIAIVQESAFGKGATIEQITEYFNENSDLLVDLEFDYLEGFIELLEAMGSYKNLVPQPSTSTTTANNNQTTTPSTSGNTSSSGGSTSSTNNAGGSTGSSTGSTSNSSGSLPAGWIPDDQLIWATEESNASGIGMSDDFTPGGELVTDIWINGMEE